MDASALKNKLAAARLSTVTIGDIQFQVRRPGKLDFLRLTAKGRAATELEAAIDAVRGWGGVTGRHFGEDFDEPVPFDSGLLELLLTDRIDLIVGLANAVADLMLAAQEREAEKKA